MVGVYNLVVRLEAPERSEGGRRDPERSEGVSP